MAELPTCLCVRGLQPYDRLTAIYQAAAELSGDLSLPDPLCVAGVPPFQRFSYIYEAFRVFSGEESLPSQVCVAGESPQDQVSRIYQALALYADDASLLSYECVRGMPIWQQWIEIYRALYVAAGSPAGLVDPACVSIASLEVLSDVFCALVADGGGDAVLLESFYIPEIVDSFSRTIAAGYTGNGDPDTFQREAAVDVLRDAHYQGGGPFVLLEDDPTLCVLVAPENLVVTPGEEEFDATWDVLPVMVSFDHWGWRLDGAGGWTNSGPLPVLSGIAASAGMHVLNVRAISTSGVEGDTATSASFTVDPAPTPTWFDATPGGATDTTDPFGLPFRQAIVCGLTGDCTRLRFWLRQFNFADDVKMAIYDDSNNLLGEGLGVAVGTASDQWVEVVLDSPVAVVNATTYRIAFCTNAVSSLGIGYVGSGGSSFIDFGGDYASFPLDPMSGANNVAFIVGVGMGVVP